MSAAALLSSTLARLGPMPDPASDRDGFLAAYAMVGRRLRHAADFLDDCRACLTAADLGRAAMLVAALDRLPADAHVPLVAEIVRTGDNGEREAVLKALMLLPEPGRFLDIAVDCCRAAVQTTFEAIACGNAYPAVHFPAAAYRAMVLKALHLGIALERIRGLEGRRDAELARMARDFRSERLAAGRPVPDDLSLLLLP